MMRLKLMHALMYPESGTPTPSGSSPEGHQPATPGHEDDGTPDDGKDPSEFDWKTMSEDDAPSGDDDPTSSPEKPEQPPAQPPQTPQKPPAPAPATVAQPPVQPPAAQPSAQDAQPQDGQPPKPPEQPGQQPPQAPPAQPSVETPEAKAERERQEAEAAAKIEQQLEEYYQIPEELAARLATEPEKVLPVLATKVHQAVMKGVQAWALQAIPAYLQHHQKVQEANTKSKEAFYSRWPGLSSHETNVLEVGRMFRQMNPKATQEEAIERIGQIVYAALGQTPPAAGANGSQPRQQTPPARQPQAPRPAGASSSQAGAPAPSDNVFESMAEDMLKEGQ